MFRPMLGFVFVATAIGSFGGCLVDSGESTEEASFPVKASDAEIAATCSVDHPNKEAVCHIPPGNPANAHTICISKSAVQKHLSLHGDYLGACQPSSGTGGSSTGQGGSAAGGNSGSGAGGSNGSGAGGSTGSGNECVGAPPCTSSTECDANQTCQGGCCITLLK